MKLTFIERLESDEIQNRLRKKYLGKKSLLNAHKHYHMLNRVEQDLSIRENSLVRRLIIEYSYFLEDLAYAERALNLLKSEFFYREEDWK